MKKIYVLTFLLLICLVNAQDWKKIEIYDSDNTQYYYKNESSNKAWVKEVGNKIKYAKNGKVAITKGHEIVLYKFDCTTRKLGIMKIVVYDFNHKVVNTPGLNDFPEMDYVTPDSIAEGLLNHFCAE